MVIICPNCSSKFKVDDTLLQKQGVKLRCSVCSHVFTVEITASDAQEPETVSKEKMGLREEISKSGADDVSTPIDTGLTYSEEKAPAAGKKAAEKPPTAGKPPRQKSMKSTMTGLFALIIIILALILSYNKGGGLKLFGNKGEKSDQVTAYPFTIKDTDTTFKYLNIEDKGQVLVIKGIVRKNENRPLKSLQVEIRIYDANNKLLAVKVVNAGKVPSDPDFLLKNEAEIDAMLNDKNNILGVLSQVKEIPYSVAFYGQPVLSTSSIKAEVKDCVWQ